VLKWMFLLAEERQKRKRKQGYKTGEAEDDEE